MPEDAVLEISPFSSEEVARLREAVRIHEEMIQKNMVSGLIEMQRQALMGNLHWTRVSLQRQFRDVPKAAKWSSPTSAGEGSWFEFTGEGTPPAGEPLGSVEVSGMEIAVLDGLNLSVGEDKIVVSAGRIQVGDEIVDVPETVLERPPFRCLVVVTKDGKVMTALDTGGSAIVLGEVKEP